MGLIWYHRLLGLEPDAALLAGCRSQWAEFGSMEAMVGTSADGPGALGPDELTDALPLVYTTERCWSATSWATRPRSLWSLASARCWPSSRVGPVWNCPRKASTS